MGKAARSGVRRHDAESITRIAFELFRERGYEATSVDQIAERAGITKPAIYHHLSGKEAILAAGVHEALDRLWELVPDEDDPLRPLDRLRKVVEERIAVEVRYLDQVAVLLRLKGNTPLERDILQRRRGFDLRVAAIVAAAMEDGDIRQDINPRLVTRLIFGMLNWVTEWYRPGSHSLTEIVDAVLAIAFEGLAPERSPGGLHSPP